MNTGGPKTGKNKESVQVKIAYSHANKTDTNKQVKRNTALHEITKTVGQNSKGNNNLELLTQKPLPISNSLSSPSPLPVNGLGVGDVWLLTPVYGSPHGEDRKGLWEALQQASSLHHLPWLLLGDFNQVMSEDEKRGRRGVNLSNCKLMIDSFNFCNVMDLGAAGPKLTCRGRSEGSSFTRVRLNRSAANVEWCDMFKDFSIYNLPRTDSDHHPLCIKCKFSSSYLSSGLPFRFENAWMSHSSFADTLASLKDSSCSDIQINLSQLSNNLVTWSKEVFGHINRRKRRVLARRLVGIQKKLEQVPNDYLVNLEFILIEESNLICF